jgi:hypothetical protein
MLDMNESDALRQSAFGGPKISEDGSLLLLLSAGISFR